MSIIVSSSLSFPLKSALKQRNNSPTMDASPSPSSPSSTVNNSPTSISNESSLSNSPKSRRVHFDEPSLNSSLSNTSVPSLIATAVVPQSSSTNPSSSPISSNTSRAVGSAVLNQALSLENSGRFLSSILFYQFLLQHHLSFSGFAEWKLGCRYNDGYGLPEDHKQAIKLWKKAADKGNKAAFAMYSFWTNNTNAANVIADKRKESMKLLEDYLSEEGNQNDADAQLELIRFTCDSYSFQIPSIAVQKSLLSRFSALATRGHAVAQWRLGCFCYHGQWMWKDVARAVQWWRKASEQRFDLAVKAIKKVQEGQQPTTHPAAIGSNTQAEAASTTTTTSKRKRSPPLNAQNEPVVTSVGKRRKQHTDETGNSSDSSEGMEEMEALPERAQQQQVPGRMVLVEEMSSAASGNPGNSNLQ